jgi:hypothetical protein
MCADTREVSVLDVRLSQRLESVDESNYVKRYSISYAWNISMRTYKPLLFYTHIDFLHGDLLRLLEDLTL